MSFEDEDYGWPRTWTVEGKTNWYNLLLITLCRSTNLVTLSLTTQNSSVNSIETKLSSASLDMFMRFLVILGTQRIFCKIMDLF